jgi:Secretion system C-terminal sorting domain
MKKIVFVFILFICVTMLYAVPITFHLADVESWLGNPIVTPWIFDADDPGMPTGDTNPFTFNSPQPFNNYAYKWFYSIDDVNLTTGVGPTVTTCLEENLAYVNGLNGFRIEFDSYELSGFEKINTVNPGNVWNTLGEAGDKRVYTGGVGRVYYNDPLDVPDMGEELVLQLTNCVLTAYVHYPTEAQMEVTTGVAAWQNDIGTGEATIAEGWGVVDRPNTDDNWEATFADAANGDRVDFEMSTMDAVIQDEYGYYSFDLGFVPANNPVQQGNAAVPLVPVPGLINFPDLDVAFDFFSAAGGGVNEDLDNLDVFFHDENPDGNLPPGILHVLPHYWEFNTTLGSFEVDIAFDMTDLAGGETTKWRILRKEPLDSDWQEWEDPFEIIDNMIVANGVTAFSEWTVGTIGDVPLPVTLSNFDAQYINGTNIIEWSTQGENSNQGWNVYRSESDELSGSSILNPELIEGTGTTIEPTDYTFTDPYPLIAGADYWYWLESISFFGESEIFGPVSLSVPNDEPGQNPPIAPEEFGLYQNYPNPFNPNTEISFALEETTNGELVIYDVKGKKIKTLFTGSIEADRLYNIIWNGEDENGQSVASGIYFYKIKAGKYSETRKMIMLK